MSISCGFGISLSTSCSRVKESGFSTLAVRRVQPWCAAAFKVPRFTESTLITNATLKEFGLNGAAQVADARSLPFPDSHFDGVISSDFFAHRPRGQGKHAARNSPRTEARAPLVIKTPNLGYLQLSLFYKRVRALLRLRNPFRVVIPHTPGHDDPQHIALTTRWELSACLSQAGFFNYRFFYAPLRRFGENRLIEVLSTEAPLVRDLLSEDVFCRAYKPIALSYFPD